MGRLEYINFLRAVAAIMVAIYHLPGLNDFLNAQAADLGKIGVVIFFAVSGFLIPSTLDRRNENWLLRFVNKRLFRLYPAYLLSMLVAVLILPMEPPSLAGVLANLSMMSGLLGFEYFIEVYWTLQIELIFYFLVVFLTFYFDPRNVKVYFISAALLLLLALASAFMRSNSGQLYPVGMPLALSIMFWGHCWRRYVVACDIAAKKYAFCWLASFILVMPLITYYGFNINHEWYVNSWNTYPFSYYIGIAFFVMFTLFWQVQVKWFSHLGEASYSIYLFHMPIYALVGTLITQKADASIFETIGYVFLYSVIAILFSIIIHRFIEKPANEFGRSIALPTPLFNR